MINITAEKSVDVQPTDLNLTNGPWQNIVALDFVRVEGVQAWTFGCHFKHLTQKVSIVPLIRL